jgi:hypothetical protein
VGWRCYLTLLFCIIELLCLTASPSSEQNAVFL